MSSALLSVSQKGWEKEYHYELFVHNIQSRYPIATYTTSHPAVHVQISCLLDEMWPLAITFTRLKYIHSYPCSFTVPTVNLTCIKNTKCLPYNLQIQNLYFGLTKSRIPSQIDNTHFAGSSLKTRDAQDISVVFYMPRGIDRYNILCMIL